MPAIAIVPGTPHSLHATRLPRPSAGPGLAARLITRRRDGLGAWRGILAKEADGIKTVIEVG